MSEASQPSIGIDVSQATLDVAVYPTAEHWQTTNDEVGIAELVERLRALEPALIVLEASGGYETPVLATLGSTGLPVVAVNPRQVRDFARATGRLAKTDALDAQVLAQFAAVVQPELRPLPDAATRELSALLARRRQLVEMRTAESNRLGRALEAVRPEIREHLRYLDKRIRELDRELHDLRSRTQPEFRGQPGLVGLDGLDAQIELNRDFLVAVALRDQPNDIGLALAELGRRRVAHHHRFAEQAAHDLASDRRIEVHAAGRDHANGLNQRIGGRAFKHIAGCAGLKQLA